MVAKITALISDGDMPALAIASLLAPTDKSIRLVFFAALALVTIPVLWRIHSSEESIGPATSSLETKISPRIAPRE
jgi:hypothetical protein